MEQNKYGYVKQKGNRYFVNYGATTHFNSGFKSKKQWAEWLKEEFKKRGLDWQSYTSWKYRDSDKIFNLVSRAGRNSP